MRVREKQRGSGEKGEQGATAKTPSWGGFFRGGGIFLELRKLPERRKPEGD